MARRGSSPRRQPGSASPRNSARITTKFSRGLATARRRSRISGTERLFEAHRAQPLLGSDHLVAQLRFAAPEAAQIVAQDLDDIVLVAPGLARGMRRDQHLLHCP